MLKNLKIKKIIPYFFILLIVLVGFFGSAGKARAATCTGQDTTGYLPAGCTIDPSVKLTITYCTSNDPNNSGQFLPPNCIMPPAAIGTCTQTTTNGTSTTSVSQGTQAECQAKASLSDYLYKHSCGMGQVTGIGSGTIWPGCALQVGQGLFIAIPGLVLSITAYFFNFLASITLYSNIYSGSTFIPLAWGVVRDLSNIFFILILLYIAIRLILGLGGHDVKQMVGKVIIIALLINFSMFFTEVVIDSSNILALIFYNKMSVSSTIPYASVGGEKDIAGSITASFDPMKLIGPTITKQAGIVAMPGQPIPVNTTEADPSTVIGMMILAGAIMCFAAYAFFIAGLSFVGRMIELFTLIIFSPFAFMSFTIPKLKGIEDLGWDSWSKSLIRSAFMAPIFMFFMYFIFLLVHANIFGTLISNTGTGAGAFLTSVLYILMPAIFILVLLLKAAKFAKKGSGVIGEYIFKGASVVGGLALTAASGGAGMALKAASSASASAGRATVGRAGAAIANSKWATERERQGKFGSGVFRNTAKAIGSANFDVRGVKIGGKTLASATGLKVGEAGKGGFTERKKEEVEKRQKRAKELQVGENDPLKQALNKTEMDLQGLLGENAQVIETLDKVIEKKRQEVNDAEKKLSAARGTPGEAAARATLTTANGDLDFAKQNKKDFRDGSNYMLTNSAGVTTIQTGTGVNIEALEGQKRAQAQAIKTENVKRNQTYANTITKKRALFYVLSGGTYTKAAAEEAAHNIVMETKLDSGEKH